MSRPSTVPRPVSKAAFIVLALLAIEFLDEFVFGAREAAWPWIRAELGLSYAQVGMLLSLPNISSSVIEPFLGILGDTGRRRALVLGGGLIFALSLFLTAASQGFALLLLSFALFNPASGAFVSLSQATLMDTGPARHESNMARWALAGSLGVVAGPMALSAGTALGIGWRGLYLLSAVLALALLAVAWHLPYPRHQKATGSHHFWDGIVQAWHALRRRPVLRWLTLLQCSDLMLDVLLGFLALYFVDVVGVTPAQAGAAVAIWTGVGLVGDLLLIPLLAHISGLRYLRWSAALASILLPAFLLVPPVWAKFVLLGLLGLFNAGWYAILKAQLYSAMPGQSGTVMTVSNLFGLVGYLIPLGLGLVAEQFGLYATMWLLLIGPLGLLLGLAQNKQCT